MKPIYIKYKGKFRSLSDLERLTGIRRCVFSWRLRNGWKGKSIFQSTKRTKIQIKKSNKESLKKAKQIWINKKDRKHPPQKNWKLYIKSRNLLRDFGITLHDYNLLLKKQKGKCAICKKPQASKNKSLGVDHCHTTGEIRGLLCDKCNRGLGLFGDNITILKKAINYLQK